MGLRWTVLENTSLTGALLGSLRALWDSGSPRTAPCSVLLGQVERTTAVLAVDGEGTGGDADRTVGAAIGGFSSIRRVAVLDYVFVAHPARGQGIGRRLIDRLLAELTPHADVVFADAEEVSEEFLRSMGWRLLPAHAALGWVTRSTRLSVFPTSPTSTPRRLAVKTLRPMDVERTVTLVTPTRPSAAGDWTQAVVAAIMRGDLDLRDLDETTSREVHASLAARHPD